MDDREVSGPHGTTICVYHYGVCQKIEAVKESIRVAKAEMDRRLESMNEFRAQIDKLTATLISRQELMPILAKLELRIDQAMAMTQDLKHTLQRREGASAPWQYIATVVVAAVVSLVLSLVTRGL